MSNYLKISSQGEIEIEALNLIGASTKDASQIGYFGTGLKYAIAWLLRNQVEFHLFSGTERISVSTETATFRGQQFSRILVNGQPTSMTTDMARDWKPWFILREIYSNAVDEGQAKLETAPRPEGTEGRTSFFIQNTPEFQYITDNFGKYFFDYKPPKLFENSAGALYERRAEYIGFYRKGINTFDPEGTEATLRSQYTYDSYLCVMSETRVTSPSSRGLAILDLVLDSQDPEVLRRFLESNVNYDYLESSIGEHLFCDVMLSSKIYPEIWERALRDYVVFPLELGSQVLDEDEARSALPLRAGAWDIVTRHLSKDQYQVPRRLRSTEYVIVEPSKEEREVLRRARNWFEERSLPLVYPVEVVDFISAKVQGKALMNDEVILISRKALATGDSEVRKTLFEEYVHLKHQCEDCTRRMQNALIDELITVLERT